MPIKTVDSRKLNAGIMKDAINDYDNAIGLNPEDTSLYNHPWDSKV